MKKRHEKHHPRKKRREEKPKTRSDKKRCCENKFNALENIDDFGNAERQNGEKGNSNYQPRTLKFLKCHWHEKEKEYLLL